MISQPSESAQHPHTIISNLSRSLLVSYLSPESVAVRERLCVCSVLNGPNNHRILADITPGLTVGSILGQRRRRWPNIDPTVSGVTLRRFMYTISESYRTVCDAVRNGGGRYRWIRDPLDPYSACGARCKPRISNRIHTAMTTKINHSSWIPHRQQYLTIAGFFNLSQEVCIIV